MGNGLRKFLFNRAAVIIVIVISALAAPVRAQTDSYEGKFRDNKLFNGQIIDANGKVMAGYTNGRTANPIAAPPQADDPEVVGGAYRT